MLHPKDNVLQTGALITDGPELTALALQHSEGGEEKEFLVLPLGCKDTWYVFIG